MLWLLVYLAIGLAVSIYLPITQARTREKVKNITPSLLADMTPDERTAYNQLVGVIETDYKPWQLVAAGLLWPLQAIGFVYSRRVARRIRDRRRCDCGNCK